nr:reverse transcriptase domain-containing protein [Tanacetum cinerariifolium]
MRTRSSSNLPVVSPNPSTSNPKRCNRKRSKQPFILEESPVDTMADQRTMAELLRAPTKGYAEEIVVPPILAEQFELKHSLINMMTSDQFFGLEKDNPNDHICWFNKITSTIKYKDVPNSAINLRLFPISLAGAARRWLEKEPPCSILTWEDLASKFINEFFPPQEQQIFYPDIHPPSNEISDEAFHAKEYLMKSIQTFLKKFNCIPFEEKATILLQAWFRFFAIKHDQLENSNELFQKLLEDLKELAEYKESLENSFKEIATSSSNQEKEEPPQDFDIRKLIREECCVEASKEQKQNMEDTILELVKICRQKGLLCIHDNVDDLIESALNTKLFLINSQRLKKEQQEVKNVVEQPAERGNCTIESLQNFKVIHKKLYFFEKYVSNFSNS